MPDDARVVAIFGPTATGKSAVARALTERMNSEVVSADSAALYAGIPVLTAAPDYPARLVGVVPLDREISVGEYQRLAHAAIDEILDAGGTAIVVGGTGLYFRAALSGLELPPPPAPGERERWSLIYDERGPEAAHALLTERDPAAAARVHPNDRRRVVRGLELAEAGSSLAPAADTLWAAETRHPTLVVGLGLDPGALDARIEARVAGMIDAGVIEEAAAAWASPLSATARKVLGLEEFATLAPEEAAVAVATATRRFARYQRKWQRRLPVAATLDAALPPEEIADEIVALAGAGKRLPRR
ncbi:MAG TPA: tRNA (adenosine(37)-N6)-dimethylallyltransferase MiaA [Gaiellaceae bacterium]